MNTRRSPLVFPSILFVALCAAIPAVAETADEGKVSGLDPVVADVVRMLDQQVESGVIEAWLITSDARPGSLTPDDLVALSQAKAPESLVLLLLERSEETGAAEPGVPDGSSRVDFNVIYRPGSSATYEADEAPWGLYAYLDGRPLVFTDGRNSILSASSRPLRFEQNLEPGPHTLRILLERHTLVSKKKNRWNHETRVFTEAASFDLVAGSAYGVDIEVNENRSFWKKDRGPVTFVVTGDDATLAELKGAGIEIEEWPALCEDLEASIPEGKKPGPSARQALESCVSWESLWEPAPGLPDRQTVREIMAEFNYRPVPATLDPGR